jgi:uncharacterized Zn finger protein (UPF0148 family)
MELIMMKCTECGTSYLTFFKSGETECPECKHKDMLLVGEDAVNKLLEQERAKHKE